MFGATPDRSATAEGPTGTANGKKKSKEERSRVLTKPVPYMMRVYLRSEQDLAQYTDTVMHRSASLGEVALFACRQPWWPGKRVDPYELVIKLFLTNGDGKHLTMDLTKETPRSILSHWCEPQHTLEQVIDKLKLHHYFGKPYSLDSPDLNKGFLTVERVQKETDGPY